MADVDNHLLLSRAFSHETNDNAAIMRKTRGPINENNDMNSHGNITKRYLVYMELPKIKIGDYHKSSCVVGNILRFHFLLKIANNENETLRLLPIKAYKVPVVNVAVIHRPFLDDDTAKGPIPKSPGVKSPIIRYSSDEQDSREENLRSASESRDSNSKDREGKSLEEDFRKGSTAAESARKLKEEEETPREYEVQRRESERRESERRESERRESERRESERRESERRESERRESERRESERREFERREFERRESERRESEHRESERRESERRVLGVKRQKEMQEAEAKRQQAEEEQQRQRDSSRHRNGGTGAGGVSGGKKRKKYFVYCELPKVAVGDYRISSVTSSELIHCHFLVKIAKDEVYGQPKLRPIKKYKRPRVNFAVIHRSLIVDDEAAGPIPRSPGVKSPMIREDMDGDDDVEVLHATMGFKFGGAPHRSKYELVSQWSLVADDHARVVPELILSKAMG